jgi:putative transposase
MCEVLGVSRSGFHGWASRAPSDRALSDAWLTSRIKEIHENARGVYGSRRVQAELRLGEGIEVSRAPADAAGRDLRTGEGEARQNHDQGAWCSGR